MSKQPETNFKERFLPRLRALARSYWEKIQQVVLRGTADVHGVMKCPHCPFGWAVYVELKRDGGRVQQLQVRKLDKARNAGAIALVVDPARADDAIKELEEYVGAENLEVLFERSETWKAHHSARDARKKKRSLR